VILSRNRSHFRRPRAKAWRQHLHWVSTDRVDIPQPAVVVAIISGLTQMWASTGKTEEA
jgi:hypothetical protein